MRPLAALLSARSDTHALRWIASRGDSQTTHSTILTNSMSLLQNVEWEAQTSTMSDIHL